LQYWSLFFLSVHPPSFFQHSCNRSSFMYRSNPLEPNLFSLPFQVVFSPIFDSSCYLARNSLIVNTFWSILLFSFSLIPLISFSLLSDSPPPFHPPSKSPLYFLRDLYPPPLFVRTIAVVKAPKQNFSFSFQAVIPLVLSRHNQYPPKSRVLPRFCAQPLFPSAFFLFFPQFSRGIPWREDPRRRTSFCSSLPIFFFFLGSLFPAQRTISPDISVLYPLSPFRKTRSGSLFFCLF